MGVEVVGSEMPQVPSETATEVENSSQQKENGKLDKESALNEPIKFGSHGEEPVKLDGDEVAQGNFPKDAVDEWPAPKQIHSFYFVRYRRYDDPKIQAKLEQLDKEMDRCNSTRIRITDEIRAKRAERGDLLDQVNTLKSENEQYRTILDEKKKELQPLRQALGKLRTDNTGRGGLCSSEEELNDLIYSLQYRIQHESIPLTEEKQILREIKQLEGTREKVIANAAMRAKIQDSLGQREAIQDQVKLMGVDLDGVKKEREAVWTKRQGLYDKAKLLKVEIDSLQKELDAVIEKREKAYQSIKALRAQHDDSNAQFFRSRNLIYEARRLAAVKDLKALEELSYTEVEKFMSLWNNDKAVRDDYEKRTLQSLDSRQLSRDGRMRNPDEKPLLAVETPIPSEPEPAAKAKRPKEDVKPSSQKDALPTQKVQKETSKKDKISEYLDVANNEIIELEKVQKKPPAEKEIDEATLKQLKREEEMAKAKMAMERKKKLAEKAAAKAAKRDQKDAEKKLKDREKKLKKKAAASAPATEPEETVIDEAAELEKVEVNDEAPITVKERVRKESIRHRKHPRGQDSLPKAILRRKKSTNYWIWAAPAAVTLVLALLALGYYYFL